MPDESLEHLDRSRAEGFGEAADAYDRHRPPYAAALYDELVALAPDGVLDVGCGNGRVAAPLAGRGLDVLGVEPDERMARIARDRGVPVETGSFEGWDDAGRRFDLIVCGTAWHWLDPVRGTARAAAVLRPGGTLARFWNYHLLDGPVLERLDPIYDEHAPHLRLRGHGPGDRAFRDPVAEDPAFSGVTTSILEEPQTFGTDAWLDLIGTFSDHRTMDPSGRAALFGSLRAAIDDLGGALHARSCTHVLWARRV